MAPISTGYPRSASCYSITVRDSRIPRGGVVASAAVSATSLRRRSIKASPAADSTVDRRIGWRRGTHCVSLVRLRLPRRSSVARRGDAYGSHLMPRSTTTTVDVDERNSHESNPSGGTRPQGHPYLVNRALLEANALAFDCAAGASVEPTEDCG